MEQLDEFEGGLERNAGLGVSGGSEGCLECDLDLERRDREIMTDDFGGDGQSDLSEPELMEEARVGVGVAVGDHSLTSMSLPSFSSTTSSSRVSVGGVQGGRTEEV